MASRPLFIPDPTALRANTHSVEFTWHPGMAISQKQKSIADLHQAAKTLNLCCNPLEISSKSTNPLGVALSAFNLQVPLGNEKNTTVENIFQAAKVFEHGGPFRELLYTSPLDAKRDPRLKDSGELKCFQGNGGFRWPLKPTTAFYDWVYLNALNRNPALCEPLLQYDGFTDIEFNPKKSLNCQAQSVALYLGLRQANMLEKALATPEAFLQLRRQTEQEADKQPAAQQADLF